MADPTPMELFNQLVPEKQKIVEEYAPYHLMPQFWEGTTAYQQRFFACPYLGDVNAQAWERGLEAGMRFIRHDRGEEKPPEEQPRPSRNIFAPP